jgi:phosphoribosylformimino-5-aminoimidazole carboxamide ribotide isomerase
MDLFPSIDIRDGKCVRLLQGDYDRQIDYPDSPLSQAQHFQEQGAVWLHIVDLDGALHGSQQNHDIIAEIVRNTSMNIEVGGGIRDDETVEKLLGLGVKHVVVGTRALEDFSWFRKLVHKHPGHIVLGLDARQDNIATRGWTETSTTTIDDMAGKVNDWPLTAIVYTDIACDGMLTGPNVESTGQLARKCNIPVIASGGVGSLDDISNLAQLRLMGIIIGRALYEKKFTLKEALNTLQQSMMDSK